MPAPFHGSRPGSGHGVQNDLRRSQTTEELLRPIEAGCDTTSLDPRRDGPMHQGAHDLAPLRPWSSPEQSKAVAGNGRSGDRKSTRLNSSHLAISYAVFCLKKKKNITRRNKVVEHFEISRCLLCRAGRASLGVSNGSTLLTPFFFFFNDTATTEIYTLSLHDALPISSFNRSFQPPITTAQTTSASQ